MIHLQTQIPPLHERTQETLHGKEVPLQGRGEGYNPHGVCRDPIQGGVLQILVCNR